jgi:hypothetical protein
MKNRCVNEHQPQHRSPSLAHAFQQRSLGMMHSLQVEILEMLWMLMLVSEDISFSEFASH